MQPELLETLRARLRDLELDSHEAGLLPRARLAFDLRLNGESRGEIGESRWGGAPDVPDGFEWPRVGNFPMAFLAQINLADLIEDEENPFPSCGLLQFFTEFDGDDCHIALVDASVALHLATTPEKLEDTPPQHRLKIVPRADLPQWSTSDYNEVIGQMSEAEQTIYNDGFNMTEGAGDGKFAGQLLGHIAGIGHDPGEDAFVIREHGADLLYNTDKRATLDLSGAKKWRNLALLDSVMSLDFCIGDAGYYNFLIHEDDLKRLDFRRVYPNAESS